MNIPGRFDNILSRSKPIQNIVNEAVEVFGRILTDEKPYFFEEYTDHGVSHIEAVLNTASEIIPDETYDHIMQDSPMSVGVFVLSVVLHDLGLYLNAEGLQKLIEGANDHVRITHLDNKTWKELWQDFLFEAHRFGDNQRRDIIGDTNWKFVGVDLKSKNKLDGKYRKLVGEFIRRHHPRIAHEIAINGLPNAGDNLPFAPSLTFDERNIIGLLARSHGTDIRSLFKFLEITFLDTWSKPYNIELIYLMTILRIADYFQIDSSRTSDILIKLKSFSSPFSLAEHYKHLDVKYVQPFSKDPETLIVHANPRNSIIFIKLQYLFSDIQNELDKSWAIIGEVYGKEPKYLQPGIKYRRIKSNIDDINHFSKTSNYVPDKIVFSVSNELPKLLIKPLYGDHPTYGVRELLQNAIDSCRERNLRHPYDAFIKIYYQKDGKNTFLCIEDNGIGMTAEVIKDYFLTVGSSYRRSSAWKSRFSDPEGKSVVQRSGRFGIGVLAAFLIGEKILLETKSDESPYGLRFETSLDSGQIELVKTNKTEAGTVIKIPINEKAIVPLNADTPVRYDQWFKQSSPDVKYFDQKGNQLLDLYGYAKAPGYGDKASDAWHELKVDGYNKVLWTYDPQYYNPMNPILTCNGILIPQALKSQEYESLLLPYTAVFDFDGNLPLTLNRNELENGIPFESELIYDIYKDIIAKMITHIAVNPFEKKNAKYFSRQTFYHPAIGTLNILPHADGFIYDLPYFQQGNLGKTILRLAPKSLNDKLVEFECKHVFLEVLDPDDGTFVRHEHINLRDFKHGAKLYLDGRFYSLLFDGDLRKSKGVARRYHRIIKSEGPLVELAHRYSQGIFTLKDVRTNVRRCNYIMEYLVDDLEVQNETPNHEFINRKPKMTFHILHKLLFEYFNRSYLIPYNLDERKLLYKNAFLDLKRFFPKTV